MKTAKEKQLEIALLTEKIERISGKKVKFLVEGEKKWYDYEGDGEYLVGKYGMSLDTKKEILTQLEKEDEDYIANIDPSEGSRVYIKKEDRYKNNNSGEIVYSVKIIKLGDGQIGFDCVKPKEGETYFGTNHMVFGSGNVKKIKKPVIKEEKKTEEISKENLTETSRLLKEIQDKINVIEGWANKELKNLSSIKSLEELSKVKKYGNKVLDHLVRAEVAYLDLKNTK